MKVIVCFLLAILISLSVWGKGNSEVHPGEEVWEGNNECKGTIQVNLCDIEVSGPLQAGGYQLLIGELKMKEPYIKYKPHKLDNGTFLIPLINLDLYGQSKDGKIIHIEEMDSGKGINVNVFIPANFILSKTGFKVTTDLILYVYVDDDIGWVKSTHERAGFKILDQSKGGIEFSITEWPIDDRMIACRG